MSSMITGAEQDALAESVEEAIAIAPAGHVGDAIVASLEAHGVDRVFTVPGESYLALLDGLRDSRIRNVVCRQEGGAAYMADAHARATGTTGVAMVTRGPGAANAYVGIHTAWQDAVPLVLFVGLVPTTDRDREAFQEFDPRAWFGTQAKRVLVLNAPDRASEVVAEAFHAARSGRPGPVIVGLPENVVAGAFSGRQVAPYPIAAGAISAAELEELETRLAAAERPLVLLAGEGWSVETARTVRDFAERNHLPVLMDWHGTWRVPTESAACIGQSAFGFPEHACRALEESDVLLVLGGALTDTPTNSFRVRRAVNSTTIVASPDAGLRGHVGRADLHLLAAPEPTAQALSAITLAPKAARIEWAQGLRDEFLRSRDVAAPERSTEYASMTRVVQEVSARVDDPLITMGAGNHGAWAQLFDTRSAMSELGPRNGSMGFSIPAATAASLALTDRNVVAIVGDGEFLMNGQELATAAQEGAAFLVILMDNRQFGTIRAHQEREYPGRVAGTQLTNPDFAGLARAYGGHGETVATDADVPAAVERAVAAVEAGRVALLHVVVNPEILLP